MVLLFHTVFLHYNHTTMTKGSKKIAIAFLAICAAFGGLYLSQASDTAIMDVLETSSGFSTDVTTTWITSTQATIAFPLYVANGESIKNYEVNYATNNLEAWETDLSAIKKVVFSEGSYKIVNGKANLILTGLVTKTTYYFVIVPVNKEGTLLTSSDQYSFSTLATDVKTEPNQTETLLGSANTEEAKFTYTLSGNNVTVKWNAIDGATKFTFATKETTSTTYTNVGSELVSKEKFSFVIADIGLYSIKIIPIDADGNAVWAEKILTVKITAKTETPGKGTPATWPALNLVLMSTFLLMLVYVVYRFRTTK